MRFYVSKTRNILNGRPWTPEFISDYICLNPLYKVHLRRKDVKILHDSGAFQDVDKDLRLTYQEALNRQLKYEQRYDFLSQRIVSYDRLVDEQLTDQGKKKCRVGEKIGWEYVKDSVDASIFLTQKREELEPRQLVLSCQGTTVEQYISCLKEIIKIASPKDCIGMGGFCIIGRNKTLQPQFFEIQKQAFPIIKEAGIQDIHLFGVTDIPVLRKWEELAKPYNFNLSTDSSAFERRSVFGSVFNPDTGKWKQKYIKADKYINYHPRDLALVNTINGIDYLNNLQKEVVKRDDCSTVCRSDTFSQPSLFNFFTD